MDILGKNKTSNKAYIAFGANLPFEGNAPQDTVISAISMLESHNMVVLGVSRLWQSPAWPDPTEPAYINAVVHVSTPMLPLDLLQTLHSIERDFGRKRSERNAARTLDIDLISYENLCIQTEYLTLPHPRAAKRAFVLLPLGDVAAQWQLPGSGQTLSALIEALPAKEKEVTVPLVSTRNCGRL